MTPPSALTGQEQNPSRTNINLRPKAILQSYSASFHAAKTTPFVSEETMMHHTHTPHHVVRAAPAQLVMNAEAAAAAATVENQQQETAATLASVTALRELANSSCTTNTTNTNNTNNYPQPRRSTPEQAARTPSTPLASARTTTQPAGNQQQQQQCTPTPAATTTSAVPPRQACEYTVLMTTIGLGIDPFFGTAHNTKNATVAAVKAVRDGMERGVLRFPSDHTNLYLHIQLGVPAAEGETEPMHVDLGHLTPLLPSSIPLLPVEIVVGGLLVRNQAASGTACTAVACITLQRAHRTQTPGDAAPARATNVLVALTTTTTATTTTAPPATTTTTPTPPVARLAGAHDPPISIPTTWAQVEQQQQQEDNTPPPYQTGASIAAHLRIPNSQRHSLGGVHVHRSTSIDMLAQVSAEMHDQASPDRILKQTPQSQEQEVGEATGSVNSPANNNNFKKLPPGVTSKKNKRLFVQHNYRDHSQDVPATEDELELVGPSAEDSRTSNAAFPLKLHETLALIERDGHADVIGWLPHGRSFKIHRQQEFMDMVLPKYFIMTKKSSFLRQLNLYGFNRLSGAGPEQGSYYHEKFLRGMKFLCRRIHRQKVNGNGIRAAGNPDGEPCLSSYPPCPPRRELAVMTAVQDRSSNNTSNNNNNNNNTNYNNKPTSQSNGRTVGFPPATTPDNMAATNQGQTGLVVVASSASRRTRAAALPPPAAQRLPKRPKVPPAEALQQEPSALPPATVFCSTAGASQPASFPLKLQRILDKLESEGQNDVISWLPHGRAFIVYDVDRFVNELMPLHFNQTKYSSFQRQLHMYHFQRITAGRDKGAYHHNCFQRGRPDLCLGMTRTRVNGKGTRRPGNPEREPHFYDLPALPSIPPGMVIQIPLEVASGGRPKNTDNDSNSQESSDEEM